MSNRNDITDGIEAEKERDAPETVCCYHRTYASELIQIDSLTIAGLKTGLLRVQPWGEHSGHPPDLPRPVAINDIF